MKLKLVTLSEQYRTQLCEMMNAWQSLESDIIPIAINKRDYHDFEAYIKGLDDIEGGRYAPSTTYFCLDEESGLFVGAVNIRHHLSDRLLYRGGHIGGGIRPSRRGRGFGAEMVRLALEKCREMGIGRVLMICNADNTASARTIIKNGGILENECSVNGTVMQRYWIDVDPSALRLTALKYGETTLPESWVFEAGNADTIMPISLLFFLIEADGKKLLFDVGCDTMPGFVRPIFESPADTLRRVGIDPCEIDEVLLSHSHHDHIDGLRHFTNATVRIHESELNAARGYLPKAPDGSLSERVKPFSGEYAVCDRIKLRHIGGHSPGSSVLLIKQPDIEYVLAGDEFYSPRCITEIRGAGNPYSREANSRFLTYCREPDRQVIIAHDGKYIPGRLGSIKLI